MRRMREKKGDLNGLANRHERKWDWELLKLLSWVTGKHTGALWYTIEKLAEDLEINLFNERSELK
jgi:hypothetical protein